MEKLVTKENVAVLGKHAKYPNGRKYWVGMLALDNWLLRSGGENVRV